MASRGAQRANVHVKTMYGRSNHPQNRGDLQGVCAGDAWGLLSRRKNEGATTKHEGSAVMPELNKEQRKECDSVASDLL